MYCFSVVFLVSGRRNIVSVVYFSAHVGLVFLVSSGQVYKPARRVCLHVFHRFKQQGVSRRVESILVVYGESRYAHFLAVAGLQSGEESHRFVAVEQYGVEGARHAAQRPAVVLQVLVDICVIPSGKGISELAALVFAEKPAYVDVLYLVPHRVVDALSVVHFQAIVYSVGFHSVVGSPDILPHRLGKRLVEIVCSVAEVYAHALVRRVSGVVGEDHFLKILITHFHSSELERVYQSLEKPVRAVSLFFLAHALSVEQRRGSASLHVTQHPVAALEHVPFQRCYGYDLASVVLHAGYARRVERGVFHKPPHVAHVFVVAERVVALLLHVVPGCTQSG